jgi:hypothetical protein
MDYYWRNHLLMGSRPVYYHQALGNAHHVCHSRAC